MAMKPSTPTQRETYTCAEVARRLGCSRDTVARQIKAGKFPGCQMGRRIIVPIEAYERWCRGDWIAPA